MAKRTKGTKHTQGRDEGLEGAKDQPAANPARLFIGSYLARKEAGLGAVKSVLTEQLGSTDNVRFVSPDMLHLTWYFLGDIDRREIPGLSELLATTCKDFSAFQINYDTLELWPQPSHARLAVATPSVVPFVCLELAKRIRGQFQTHCLGDSKPFKPHMTLARLRQSSPRVTSFERPSGERPVETRLSEIICHDLVEICLIESIAGKGRHHYQTIISVPAL